MIGVVRLLAGTQRNAVAIDHVDIDAAASAWLKLIDTNDSSTAWEHAAAHFREHLSQAEWTDKLTQARGPLGKLKARSLISCDLSTKLPDAPSGKYVVMEYQTLFETGGLLGERLTMTKDKDGQLRAAGYYIIADPGG